MIKKNSFYLSVLVLLVGLFSCETPPPCDDANGVQVNLGFYSYQGTTLKDTLIDSLVIFAIDNQPVLYSDGTGLKKSSQPLNLSMLSDTSVFIFQFGTDATDTIEFYYTQYTRLVSHECGFVNFYDLTGIKTTNNLIDSVWVRKDLVEFGDEENVKIYF